MWAGVASFEGGDFERLRQLGEERGRGMPEGVKRVLVFADREAGRRLFITYFDTPEAVRAAEQRFEAMGDEIPDEVRRRRTAVDGYEVVFDESA